MSMAEAPGQPAGQTPFTIISGPPEAEVEAPAGADWLPVDLSELIDQMASGRYTPERPTIGMLDGAMVGLIYSGRVSGIAGDSSSGKTWTALAIGALEMAKGSAFMLIDLEDSAAGTLERLFDMGVGPEVIRRQFIYLSPETRVDLAAQGLVQATITERNPSLVVIDSTGEALAVDGKNPNADEEVALWMRKMPKMIAKLGPAVLLLDHVTKASEGRGDPSGTQRKKSAITGAQYNQQAKEPFRRGKAGHAAIVCTKDRRGYWANGQQVAELRLEPREDGAGVGDGGGAVSIVLCATEEGFKQSSSGEGFRPTGLMQRVSIAVENSPTLLSYSSIQGRVAGKKEFVRLAADLLIKEGYLEVQPGARGAQLHKSAKPYRERMEPSADPGIGPEARSSAPGTWNQASE